MTRHAHNDYAAPYEGQSLDANGHAAQPSPTAEPRDRWIQRVADTLTEAIGVGHFGAGRGYTPDACRAIATTMHDIPFGQSADARGLGSERMMIAALLTAQGLDDATVSVISHAWRRVDWAALFVGNRTVAQLFGESTVTAFRNVAEGRLRPAIVEREDGRALGGIKVSLGQALSWVAWRRVHPQEPGAGVSYPPE